MSDLVPTDDLGTYLGITLSPDQEDRAEMLIDDAIAQALSIVTVGDIPDSGATEANLPVGAASVIRAAVARIFLNPSGVTVDTEGPYSVTRPASTGALFSSAERGALRRMAGRGSAFSIDLIPGYPDSVFPPTVPADS